jgi:predicted cytidylate kinase
MSYPIITISGDPGSGKSTIAKKLAQKLQAERIYVGQIRRKLAKTKGMSLTELNKYAQDHPETDVVIDKNAAKRAKQLAKQSPVIVEGRTQFHFLPESLKVYVAVDINEGAKRIWKDLQSMEAKAKRNEGDLNSLADVAKSIKSRVNSDKKRYMKYYNIDHTDKSQFDLVLDTTKLNREEAVEQALKAIKTLTKNSKQSIL